MSKKQQVYDEYEKSYFEYMKLCGKKPLSNKYGKIFYNIHSTNDILCLKEKIERDIIYQKRQNIINEWLKTEEGVKWYNEKKSRREEIVNILSNSLDELKKTIQPFIIETLGNEWDITSVCRTQLTISLMEIEDGNDIPTSKFGHHFTILWGDNRRYDEIGETDNFYLSFNYGCMGAFKIEENSSRIKLIVGMGKLLANKPLIDKLTNIIREFYDKAECLTEEKWELSEEMKNPSVIDF